MKHLSLLLSALVLLGFALGAEPKKEEEYYPSMIMTTKPATQPVAEGETDDSPRAPSLAMKVNTLMAASRKKLEFPARRVDYIMRGKAAQAEQIPEMIDIFSGQPWTISVTPRDIKGGQVTIDLPVRLAPRDLLLTAAERSQAADLFERYAVEMDRAEAAEKDAKSSERAASKHARAADSADNRAGSWQTNNPQQAAALRHEAAQARSFCRRAEGDARRFWEDARTARAEAERIDRLTQPIVTASNNRRPASTIVVKGVTEAGVVTVEVTRVECLVAVAEGSGLREIAAASYDFAGHFNSGNDAAVVWRIEARAQE